MKRITCRLAITMFASLTLVAIHAPTSQAAEQKAAASSELTDGEIRRIDKDTRKLTIRHGPIRNLDMPAMTMVFQVNDPALLDKVNIGDKIKFYVENIGGAYTVTRIEPAK